MTKRRLFAFFFAASLVFNGIWMFYVGTRIRVCYKCYCRRVRSRVERFFEDTDWRFHFYKEPYLILSTRRGPTMDLCFYAEDADALLCSAACDPSGDNAVKEQRFALAAPNFSLTWKYGRDAGCTDVALRYNGGELLRDVAGDGKWEKTGKGSSRESQSPVKPSRPAAPSRRISAVPSPAAANVPAESASALEARPSAAASRIERARAASDKNQAMDALLGGDAIPADYGERMVALFRDGSQDVLTRDFAVQHLGLYAQALARRGEYDAASADARALRAALDDAAGETRTIVAAAAFRALADVAEFDQNVDARSLDARLAACVADDSASVAARVMAAQLCGERRVSSARPALERLSADSDAPVPLRRAAVHSLGILGGKESGI